MLLLNLHLGLNSGGICFGKLIDIGGQDYVTDNEIEFYEDDVIEQYEMNVIPLLYMDFLL